MVRSFSELHRADLGFEAAGILQGRLVLPIERFWEEVEGGIQPVGTPVLRMSGEMERMRAQLRERAAAHPGVGEVALARHTPLAGACGGFSPFEREGREGETMPPGEDWLTSNQVDSNFLPMMGAELLAGRWFTEEDHAAAPPVAIISEAPARRYWGDEDPVGDRFLQRCLAPDGDGGFTWERSLVTVVGVVRSLREWDVRHRDETVYTPLAQAVPAGGLVPRASRGARLSVFAAYEGDPGPVGDHLRMAAAEAVPGVPLEDVATMEELAGRWLREPRFFMGLLGALGLLALVLAAGGIAAVIGFGVSRRTREIGLQVALGARDPDVLRLVMRETLLFSGVGLALGMGSSLAAAGLLESLLYEVAPRDPLTLAGIVLFFSAAALLAAWIPARNALRVDSGDALRAE